MSTEASFGAYASGEHPVDPQNGGEAANTQIPGVAEPILRNPATEHAPPFPFSPRSPHPSENIPTQHPAEAAGNSPEQPTRRKGLIIGSLILAGVVATTGAWQMLKGDTPKEGSGRGAEPGASAPLNPTKITDGQPTPEATAKDPDAIVGKVVESGITLDLSERAKSLLVLHDSSEFAPNPSRAEQWAENYSKLWEANEHTVRDGVPSRYAIEQSATALFSSSIILSMREQRDFPSNGNPSILTEIEAIVGDALAPNGYKLTITPDTDRNVVEISRGPNEREYQIPRIVTVTHADGSVIREQWLLTFTLAPAAFEDSQKIEGAWQATDFSKIKVGTL
ncbi:MAG: hypothetical protein JWL85_1009 [Candidatus Saccharibacteria bacterium]|nr:hypothetical protein [Candidatus Saccharibacteria bacterium]